MSKENYDDIKIKVEAILFSYGDWININDIQNVLKLDSRILVENALKELQNKYKNDFPFFIEVNENGKWRMALKSEFEELVTDVIQNVEIPKNILKVLSVIAYEQPVSKTRLAEILGKSVKQEVGWLYRNKFLSYEKKGIGKYFKVTKKFYDYFKLDVEQGDFRDRANKNMSEFLEEFPTDNEENISNLNKNLDENIEIEKEN